MKALSGREFARLVERHGWPLLCESTAAITSTAELEAWCGCRFRFTATDRSRPVFFAILQSWRSFRLASWISAMIRQHDDAARRRQEDVGEHCQGTVTVARMERSDIRGDTFRDARLSPDVTALHPGYEAGKALGVA
jgi:hypothetical protein